MNNPEPMTSRLCTCLFICKMDMEQLLNDRVLIWEFEEMLCALYGPKVGAPYMRACIIVIIIYFRMV